MESTSFYTEEEVHSLGFKSVGYGCLISRKACFYGADRMIIGNNVRIDDFSILSGSITLGSHIHISAYVALYGGNGIEMKDYTGVSCRTTIYSAMDDFSGDYLIGPIHPEGSTCVTGGKVIIERFAQIGAHCVVFPDVIVAEGCLIGACTMLRHSTLPWGVYVGIPATRLKERRKTLLRYVSADTCAMTYYE